MNSEGDNAMPCKTTVAELIDNVYLRSRRNKTHINTTKQGEQKSRGFSNGAFTNDYAITTKIISDKALMACNFCLFWSCIIIDKRTSFSSIEIFFVACFLQLEVNCVYE
jgi:hypothetical protein